MVDDVNKNAAAQAAANNAEAQKTDINQMNVERQTPEQEQAAREGREAVKFQPAMGAAPTPKVTGRSGIITNPTPAVDPDAPVPVEDNTPAELPQATINEMEAGKEALKRNKPVNVADNGAELDDGRVKGPLNPVDATERQQQTGKV